MFNISVATLRLYESEGLILPQKSKGQHRSFTVNDIKRISCIRELVNEKGLNLAGVRMLFSALPCWDIKKCSDRDRENCPAYKDSQDPCWISKTKDSICGEADCSLCPVYVNFSNCTNIKQILQNLNA